MEGRHAVKTLAGIMRTRWRKTRQGFIYLSFSNQTAQNSVLYQEQVSVFISPSVDPTEKGWSDESLLT